MTRAHVDHQRQEVLRAIAHIATKLGLDTIVEGVELEAQRAALIELGSVAPRDTSSRRR